MTEVIVYGLLAAAIVAGVLYAGGRTPLQIGTAAGAIAGFVAVFAIIAPRARRPVKVERTDDAPWPPAADTHAPAPDLRVDQGQSPLTDTSKGDFSLDQQDENQRRNTRKRGRRRRTRHAG